TVAKAKGYDFRIVTPPGTVAPPEQIEAYNKAMGNQRRVAKSVTKKLIAENVELAEKLVQVMKTAAPSPNMPSGWSRVVFGAGQVLSAIDFTIMAVKIKNVLDNLDMDFS